MLISAAGEFGKAARVTVRGWFRPMTSIFRLRSRGNWPTRFAALAARRIFGCCRPMAARATGCRKPKPASARRALTRSRLEAATYRPRPKNDDAVFPAQVPARARRHRHSRHRRRYRILHADGTSQPGCGLHRAHGGDGGDRRHGVHADRGAAAAGYRRPADAAVGDFDTASPGSWPPSGSMRWQDCSGCP